MKGGRLFIALVMFAFASALQASPFEGSWSISWGSFDYPGFTVPSAGKVVSLESHAQTENGKQFLDGTWGAIDENGVKHAGAMHGTVTRNVWSGVWWTGMTAKEHGNFELTLSRDGKSFDGTYTAAGLPGTKHWHGVRN